MRVYLTGFMGAGKTTVGRLLAERLEFPFVDLDGVIEKRAGLAVSEIFERHGEAHFRALEQEELRRTAQSERLVVATGGGTPVAATNREWMRAHGTVVWIDTAFERIAGRLGKEPGRPLWGSERDVRRLFAERGRFYRDCDLSVAVGLRPAREVAAEVAAMIEQAGLR